MGVRFGEGAGPVLFQSLSHSMGNAILTMALTGGAQCILMPVFDLKTHLLLVAKHKAGPQEPFATLPMYDNIEKNAECPGLRLVSTANNTLFSLLGLSAAHFDRHAGGDLQYFEKIWVQSKCDN